MTVLKTPIRGVEKHQGAELSVMMLSYNDAHKPTDHRSATRDRSTAPINHSHISLRPLLVALCDVHE